MLEQYHWLHSGALTDNFYYVLHLVFSIPLIVDFEYVLPVGIVKIFFIVIK